MILSFSKDDFKERILNGTKKTTIRKAKRWKVLQMIHFWRGNPRNVSQNPHEFGHGMVAKVDEILIEPNGCICDGMLDITVNGHLLNREQIEQLIADEGFDNEADFKAFFPETFRGDLITWKYFTPTIKI